MVQEIERKFLVTKPIDENSLDCIAIERIDQYYIILEEERECRIRMTRTLFPKDFTEVRYFLTVKSGDGLSRTEVETLITKKEYVALKNSCPARLVSKMRYTLKDPRYMIDKYLGPLSSLCTVEVDFLNEESANTFTPPDWFDKDVTNDPRYKNRNLAVHPEIVLNN